MSYLIPEPGLFRIPAHWNWPSKVPAIWVGGCTRMGGTGWPVPESAAHSHLEVGPAKNWICVLNPEHVYSHDERDLPNPVVIHELGHVITGQAHSATWAKVVRNWGGYVLPEEIESSVCPRYQTFIRQ